MKIRQRLVVDTNVLVSHLLLPGSVPDRVVLAILDQHELLTSEVTQRELAEVLLRRKFDRLVSRSWRLEILELLDRISEHIPIATPIRACRDPRDDKFLELAVNGEADFLVTGDADLLSLHPFHNVAIVTPAAWFAANLP